MMGLFGLFGFLRFLIAFLISFAFLSISINEKPLFYHLSEELSPFAKVVKTKSVKAWEGSRKEAGLYFQSLFGRWTFRPDESDTVSSKKSSAKKSDSSRWGKNQEEFDEEYKDEEKAELKRLLGNP